MFKDFVAGKRNRPYCWENLSQSWFMAQKVKKADISEFGLVGAWPEVNSLFYDAKVQDGLAKVKRWQSFAKDNSLRPQNVLKHSVALVFLADSLVNRMNGYLAEKIDKELLLKACMVHDIPEGIIQEDVPDIAKSSKQDAFEFTVFAKLVDAKYGTVSARELKKIFLLQFCLGDTSAFTKVRQRMMRQLAESHHLEALMFKVIEKLDYLLYAEEQWVRFGNDSRDLIEKVASDVVPIIEKLVPQIPNFEVFWTPKVSKHFSQFLTTSL